MSRLYDWVMTRLNCCVIGIGCMALPIAAVGVGTGWLTWTVVT